MTTTTDTPAAPAAWAAWRAKAMELANAIASASYETAASVALGSFGEADRNVAIAEAARAALAAHLDEGPKLIASECSKVCEDLDAYDEDDPMGSCVEAIRARFGLPK